MLFLANAFACLVWVFLLVAVARDGVRPKPTAGGYRVVVRGLDGSVPVGWA